MSYISHINPPRREDGPEKEVQKPREPDLVFQKLTDAKSFLIQNKNNKDNTKNTIPEDICNAIHDAIETGMQLWDSLTPLQQQNSIEAIYELLEPYQEK